MSLVAPSLRGAGSLTTFFPFSFDQEGLGSYFQYVTFRVILGWLAILVYMSVSMVGVFGVSAYPFWVLPISFVFCVV